MLIYSITLFILFGRIFEKSIFNSKDEAMKKYIEKNNFFFLKFR